MKSGKAGANDTAKNSGARRKEERRRQGASAVASGCLLRPCEVCDAPVVTFASAEHVLCAAHLDVPEGAAPLHVVSDERKVWRPSPEMLRHRDSAQEE